MVRQFRSTVAVAGAAILFVTALAAGAAAQGERPGRRGGFGPGGGPGGAFPLRQLNLTEAQRQQVREVMERNREAMREAGTRLREAHQAQRAAVETVPVNESLIRSTTQVMSNAQTDMALLRARVHSEVWSLLTPDQQAKAKELKAQRESRQQERRQRRRPPQEP